MKWLSHMLVLAIMSALGVGLLYIFSEGGQTTNEYTQWTLGAAAVLFIMSMIVLGATYILVRVAGQQLRKMFSNRMALTMLIVCSISGGTLIAQSCFGSYGSFTTSAYNTLEQCVLDTNDDPWYSRLAIRSLCNANWVSDSQQGWIEYVLCMSIDRLW